MPYFESGLHKKLLQQDGPVKTLNPTFIEVTADDSHTVERNGIMPYRMDDRFLNPHDIIQLRGLILMNGILIRFDIPFL